MESTTEMEIGEVFTVKDEIDVSFNEAPTTETCKICETEVPTSDLEQHVKKHHGLGAGAYQVVAEKLEGFFGDNEAGIDQQEAPTGDQVENGCTFQCRLCDYKIGSWRTMTDHYGQNHRNEKRDPWGPHELAVTKKFYKCQECSGVLLQDKRIISAHMNSKHRARPLKSQKMVNKGLKSATKLEVSSGDNNEGTDQGEASPKDQIENGCKFQCKLCDYVSNSWRYMGDHYCLSHRNERRDSWGPHELAVTKKFYKCQECPRVLLQDKRVIYFHMRKDHNSTKTVKKDKKDTAKPITLVKAGTNGNDAKKNILHQELIGDACKFKCNYCPMNTNSWRDMTKHIFKTHRSAPKLHDPMDLVVEKVTFQCNKCGKSLLQDKRIIYNHTAHCSKSNKIAKKETEATAKATEIAEEFDIISKDTKFKDGETAIDQTSVEGASDLLRSICKFQCQPCGMVFYSWRSTTEHLSKKHKGEKQKNNKYDMTKYIIESHYHKCFLCDKVILQDLGILGWHIKPTHGLGMEEYRVALARRTENKDKTATSQTPATTFGSSKSQEKEANNKRMAPDLALGPLTSKKQPESRKISTQLTKYKHEMITVQVDPDLFSLQKEGVTEISDPSDAKTPVGAQSHAQSQEVEVITVEDADDAKQVSNWFQGLIS